MIHKLRRKLVGNRAFYAMMLAVVIPIIVQNAITNFVSLLDNLMVGAVGTEEMSGVAVANQLIFVFNLAIFGAVSGAGIFAAQYYGAGNTEGVRACCRYKFYTAVIISALAIVLFAVAGRQLISLYLNEGEDPARAARTLDYGMQYLRIMLLGLPPFAFEQCYASTLRETGETKLPMFAGIAAVLVNLLFNYLLIFGKFGFPVLGVAGAAYATVLSRYVQIAIVMIYTHRHSDKFQFADGLYRTMRIPRELVKQITVKGAPLMINEIAWSIGQATLTAIYAKHGLDVVAATNISSTVTNVFSVAFLSMGSAAAIIVGQDLGANRIDTAKDHTVKLQAFSVFVSVLIGALLFLLAPAIPHLYNTTSSVHHLAERFMRVYACFMPFFAFCNCSYFVMRSGGKTIITFLFDSGCTWVLCVPVAYITTLLFKMTVVEVYSCVYLLDVVKSIIAYILIRKGIWINNMVSDADMQVA